MTTTQDERPRRIGRPAKSAEDRKSAMVRFRVREDLKEKIDAAAAISGLSSSEEGERRLEQSFEFEKILKLLYGNAHTREFFINLTSLVETIQTHENPPGVRLGSENWKSSDTTRAALRRGLQVVIEKMIPPAHNPENLRWAPEGKPLTNIEKQQFASAISYMESVGEEFARLLTGQEPELEKALMRPNAAEH